MDVKMVVANGFNVLTREQRDRINLETLDINSYWNCVIGQAFPLEFFSDACRWIAGLEFESIDAETHLEDWLFDHGFDIDVNYSQFTCAELQAEWIRQLSAERTSE
jgi:hypothetical protein